ncbi:hypothetical protein H6P81_006332 [Aristolochia fimbriata]|uniref:Myb-like domain-containing protein n=1 Tax=Aristolochia fimbriata TaxID=158543 RepID=A0AAV7EX74_ARIFI|nr:hypothetical protein H6P81_006332 [Aristolochia fimbriata]
MEGAHHVMNNPQAQPDIADRFPQWSQNETRELIAIRAELDRTFMETKRNRLLWDLISNRMREKGFYRSAEQCKCKWKNLVTRYKGSETMDPEAIRQFPFQEELRAIFAARMQRLLWQQESESGGGGGGSSSGAKKTGKSDEEEYEEESISMDHHDQYGVEAGKTNVGMMIKKRKVMIRASTSSGAGGGSGGDHHKYNRRNAAAAAAADASNKASAFHEMVEEFLKSQLRIEMEWCKEEEAREEERRGKEMEWRRRMEALERERILMDSRWREREEQRRAREEARADRRDQLITALLNKFIHDNIN